MNRASLARRFAPLLAVVVVQLLIIALAPSRAPQQVAADDGGAGFVDPLTGETQGGAGTAVEGTTSEGATGAGGAAGPGTGGRAAGGGAAAGGTAGGVAAGD